MIKDENVVLYPIFLDLSGRQCVVVGGGEVASRKARKLLQARAEVVVISPEITPELESIAVEVHRRPYKKGDLGGAYLAFTATDSREVNAEVAREAKDLAGKARAGRDSTTPCGRSSARKPLPRCCRGQGS